MVLFLDFDGVITTSRSWVTGADPVDQVALQTLRGLLQRRPCRIVVTSTWRHDHSLDELRQILAPLAAEVVGTTALLENRGQEILDWVWRNDVGDQFIVVDDEIDEIRPYIDDRHIVHVENGFATNGFQPVHLDEALTLIDRLTSSDP